MKVDHQRGPLVLIPPKRIRAKAAFTLTELLTSLAVLMPLILVFMPGLHARDQAAGTRCLWNQRQLMMAVHMYADDNQGMIVAPPAMGGAGLSGGGYWPGPQPGIVSGISREEAMNRVRAGLEAGPLWRYLPDYEAYHCPDDPRFKLNDVGRGWAYDSYSKANGMNGGNWQGNAQPSIQKIASVPEPPLAMFFVEEADPRGHNIGTWVINTAPPGWVDPLALNHNRGSTFSFVDGRAELRKWRDPATISALEHASQGIPAFYWRGGDLDNPDFRWVFRRYKHANWKPGLP